MERNLFIVKSVDLNFHRIPISKHMSTHTGKKTIHCDICRVKFSLKVNLKRHMEHTLKRNLFIVKFVALNLPGIHISKVIRQHTLGRNLYIL